MAQPRTTRPRAADHAGITAAIGLALAALLLPLVALLPAGAQEAQAPAATAARQATPEEEATAPPPPPPQQGGAVRPAAPQVLPEEEIASRIADAYGVEVLQVKRDDLVGGPAYAVRVMRPGGDSNSALRVSTLMVDGVTGELIPQFRHRTSGYQGSGAFRAEPNVGAAGEALRLRTFRAGPEAIQ